MNDSNHLLRPTKPYKYNHENFLPRLKLFFGSSKLFNKRRRIKHEPKMMTLQFNYCDWCLQGKLMAKYFSISHYSL